MNFKKLSSINKSVYETYAGYKKYDNRTLRLFYRPISLPLASLAQFLGFSANQVTYLKLLVLVICSIFIVQLDKGFLIFGSFLYYFTFVLDCVDGNIARTKKRSTLYGQLIDGYSDNLCSIFYIFVAISIILQGDFSTQKSILIISAGFCVPLFVFMSNSLTTSSNYILANVNKNDDHKLSMANTNLKLDIRRKLFNFLEDFMILNPIIYFFSIIFNFQLAYIFVFSLLRVLMTTIEVFFKLFRYSKSLNIEK